MTIVSSPLDLFASDAVMLDYVATLECPRVDFEQMNRSTHFAFMEETEAFGRTIVRVATRMIDATSPPSSPVCPATTTPTDC